MHKGRLEAFSDGVLAIIITIMVLDLHVPHGTTFVDLKAMAPILLCYALSYIFVGIYWNNHHHLMQPVQKIDGTILWANLHLLFWLSLIPFATAWMGENNFARSPVALYGIVLLGAAIAFMILARRLIVLQGPDSLLARALQRDWKSKVSVVLYVTAIPVAFVCPAASLALYGAVAIMWLVPDSRIEHALK